MCTRYIFLCVTKEMSLRNFLSLTFLVVLGDAIAEALPVVAAQADMLETIGMAALEAGGLDCGAVTDPPPPPIPPRIKEVEQVSGGKRKKKTTQDDLLQWQCETLRLQKETLVLKKRKLELEINQLEMSLSYTT